MQMRDNEQRILRGALWCHAQELGLLPAEPTLLASHRQVVSWIYFISEGKSTNSQRTRQLPRNSPVFFYMWLVLSGNAPHTREQRATCCPFLSMIKRGPEAVMNYGGFSHLSTSLGQVEDSPCLAHCSQLAASPLDCPDRLLTVIGIFFNIN